MNKIMTFDDFRYPQIFATVSRKLTSIGIQTAIQDNPLTILETAQTSSYGKFSTVSRIFISYMLNLLNNWQLETFLLQETKEMGL